MLLFIRMKPNLKYIVMKTESHHITEKKLKVAILYIQYINGKRKKSHRIKSHKTSRKKITGIKDTRKKGHRKNSHNIFFPHLLYPRKVTVCIITRLPFMYCIYNISFIGRDVRKSNIRFIEISCPPKERQTIICISDFW
jgi:hypothetical protein